MKITQLLKYIADLNPQNTPARLAFYNFLRHFQFSDDQLDSNVINSFFCHALEYPHWETNKSNLGKEIQLLLENFSRTMQVEFDKSHIYFPQNIQLIEIQSFSDMMDISHRYAQSITAEDDHYRIVPDQGRKAILVILHQNKSVTVRVFDKKFVIRNGQLEPLRKQLILAYDENLELKENFIHLIEVAPYLLTQFTMHEGQPTGCILRGYVFQKYQELEKLYLEEQTKLFIPLKRMEQLFIDKESDPYYLNLIAQLSETPERLKLADLSVEKTVRRLVEKAELANKEIFNGDKTLAILIKESLQLLKPTVSRDSELWLKHRPQDLIK